MAIEFFIPGHRFQPPLPIRRAVVYQIGTDGQWTWHHGECPKRILGTTGDSIGTTYGEYYDTQQAAFEAAMTHMKERHV